MAKKKEETELVKQETQAVAAFDYGDDAVDMNQVAPGFENQSNQDVSIPFIVLLQSNSPVVTEQKVEGAMAGQWYNTQTQQIWKNPSGLLFVPAITVHEFIQYVPRDIGGGFVARYPIDHPVVEKAKKESKNFGEYFVDTDERKGPDGDELTETFNVWGVVCDEENTLGFAILSFKSTMIRCYKNWMSQVRMHTIVVNGQKKRPPLFAHLAKFTTEVAKKDKFTYHVPVYTPAISGSVGASCLAPTDERFLAAKSCYDMYHSGQAKVNYDAQNVAGTGSSDDGFIRNGQPAF